MLREGRACSAAWSSPATGAGEFPRTSSRCSQTFATQSALAIQNARLFRAARAWRTRAQVAVPGQHVPRAAHAAERHHRLLRDAPGGGRGPRAGGVHPRPPEDQRGGQAPAGADQRHPRPLQDRGRADGPVPGGVRRGELVQDVAAIVQPLVEKNGNAWTSPAPPTSATMHADQTKVGRRCSTCSPTPPSSPTGHDHADGAREDADDWIVFAVADTGIGMTEEQLGRLFEAFSQAEASTSRRTGGPGWAWRSAASSAG